MNDLYNREWNTKNNPSDSVRATKTIMAYNMGPTSLVNRLNELKARGYDIYQSLDWTQDDSIPVESREYNDFILRNINNSISRNQTAYELSKKKNSDKVERIRKGFDTGGVAFKTDTIVDPITKDTIFDQQTGEDSYIVWSSRYNPYNYSEYDFQTKEALDFTSNDFNTWYKDWLNSRRDILKNNADATTYGYIISQAPDAKDFYDFSNHNVFSNNLING